MFPTAMRAAALINIALLFLRSIIFLYYLGVLLLLGQKGYIGVSPGKGILTPKAVKGGVVID